jgi:nucleoside-diphosphate-sugar epimerase
MTTDAKTILVTGAGGYIGSVLAPLLLDVGYKVVALDRYYFGQEVLSSVASNENLSIVQKDVRNLTEEDFKGIYAVVDLAALSNDPIGEMDPVLTRSINYQARVENATMAKRTGVSSYVLASSCSVYGFSNQPNLDEHAPLNPISEYALCNQMAEKDVLCLKDDAFAPVAIRNGTVYGLSPRMRFDLVVNLMTLHAVTKNAITVLGGGRQARPLIHVRDVAETIMKILSKEPDAVSGEIYNLADGNYTALEIAYIVRESLPFMTNIDIAPDDVDKRSYSVSCDKVRNELGIEPKWNVEKGIKEVYKSLRSGLSADEKTNTLRWYKYLQQAESLVKELSIDGRMF